MSVNTYERLISLEDEEIASNNNSTETSSKSRATDLNTSCKVPMANDVQDPDELDRHVNRHTSPGARRTNGLSLNISGLRIHLNADQLKYLSLITLTLQNAALNLTMRAASTQEVPFSKSVAVTLAELFKLVSCIVIIFYEESYSLRQTAHTLKSHIVDNYLDTLKVAVPSFVYYVQNNLLYVGSSHLDAATNQVTYQLKILTTACFSVLMLNKRLSRLQWVALVVLFTGVALITMVTTSHNDKPHISHDEANRAFNTTGNLNDLSHEPRREQPLVGFVAVLIACCLSGFAGVYFEKILKNSQVSLWLRNIQLSAVTLPIGLMQILYEQITSTNGRSSLDGLFQGFTFLTWLCIILQAQGGLLVAVVVKFANNILKGFATSMAIVISTVASTFLFDFSLSAGFLLGASMVIGSVLMYSKN